MKTTVRRLFALLLCLCLLLPAAPLALAGDRMEELAAPTWEPSAAELSPVVGAESLLGEAADAESGEQEHFEPMVGGVPETEETFFVTPGETGYSLGGGWGDESVISAAWDAIGEDEIVEEGPLSPVIGPAEGPEGEAALLGSPSLSLSADSLTMSKGASQAIYVYIRGLDRPVTLKCYTSDSGSYSLSWGEWDTANQRIKLTVKGLGAGSGKVSIKLLTSPSESVIDAKTLSINVADAKLTEGVDYLLVPSVDENGDTVGAVILAAPESAYAGSAEVRCEDAAIESVRDERPYVRVRLRNAREGTVIAAYYSDFGRLISFRAVPVEDGQTEAELDFGKIMPKSVNLRVYLLDKDGCPQTKSR